MLDSNSLMTHSVFMKQEKTTMKMFHPMMLGSTALAFSAASLCSMTNDDVVGDQGMGGGSGGMMLGKTSDTKFDDGTIQGSGAGEQMQQATDYGPEDGDQAGDDDTAGEQADQGAEDSAQQGDDADSDLVDAAKPQAGEEDGA